MSHVRYDSRRLRQARERVAKSRAASREQQAQQNGIPVTVDPAERLAQIRRARADRHPARQSDDATKEDR